MMVKWFRCRLYVIGFLITLVNLSCGEEAGNGEYIPEQLFEVGAETITTRNKNGRIISEIEKKEYKRIVILATPFYTFFKALNVENNAVGILNRERVKQVSKRIKSVGEGPLLDLEKIIQLNPDLIICNSYQLENLKSLTIPILACDEYLEVSPKGRLKFLMLIGTITKSCHEAENILKDLASKYQNHKSLNSSILKLDNFGEAWYQPGCDTYISKVIRMAGANPVCIQKSDKSEKIAHESAIFKLNENSVFLFMDWGKQKRGWKKRIKYLLETNNYPKKILYCNTTQTEYFEESVLNSHLIINDLNTVLKTGTKGRFFEMKTLEK